MKVKAANTHAGLPWPSGHIGRRRLAEELDKGGRILGGLASGAVLGVVGYPLAVIRLQRLFNVPSPHPRPPSVPLSVDPPVPGYWILWACVPVVVILGALAAVSSRRGRLFGLALLAGFIPLGAGAAWFVISMDLWFAPN